MAMRISKEDPEHSRVAADGMDAKPMNSVTSNMVVEYFCNEVTCIGSKDGETHRDCTISTVDYAQSTSRLKTWTNRGGLLMHSISFSRRTIAELAAIMSLSPSITKFKGVQPIGYNIL